MKHRARWASAFAVTAALAGFLALSLPASAGQPQNSFIVNKTVVGTPPAGTTFTVHVTCVQDGVKVPPATQADIVFDEHGTPTTSNEVMVGFGSGECTASETVNGGATTVAYACRRRVQLRRERRRVPGPGHELHRCDLPQRVPGHRHDHRHQHVRGPRARAGGPVPARSEPDLPRLTRGRAVR
jgi:hypothetical protein